MEDRPLSSLLVLELGERVSAPYCGRLLAALGAEVIKIEKPLKGDAARSIGPFLSSAPDPETSSLFLYLNTNKKSITLDWTRPTGRELLEQLISQADILLDNHPTDQLTQCGLTYEHMKSLNARLLVVSLSDYGETGPYRDWQATPLTHLALGGYLYLSGEEHREPLALPGWQVDYLMGLYGYFGTLAALWSRAETGQGQHVEMATMDAMSTLHQFTTVMYSYEGVIRKRHGNRWEDAHPYGRYPNTVLPCKDGYVSFSVSIEHQWELMCQMIGRPDLIEDPRLQNFQDRRAHADELDAILMNWLKDKTKDEVFHTAAGTWSVPVGPVLDIGEVLDDPQYQDRGFWKSVQHPVAGEFSYPSLPFDIGPDSLHRAPLLGEHNRHIYGERLGFTAKDIVLLRQMQVI